MEEILKKEAPYLLVTIALLSFLLGIIASIFNEWVKRWIEKRRLISIFVADIYKNWSEIDSLKAAPIEPYWGRMRFYFKGVRNLSFSGQPEYEFEVHNLKFYETEGFKLVQHLRKRARQDFWEVYILMRDAEAVRQVIKSLEKDHEDRAEYQKLFVELISQLSKKYADLANSLEGENSLFARFLVWAGSQQKHKGN